MRTEEMQSLRSLVAAMAENSQRIFDLSVEVLKGGATDENLAAVRSLDTRIDDQELEIDRRCIELLALKEPFAGHFRYVFSMVKVVKELERVGDQSKTVAKWTRKLAEPPSKDMLQLAAKTDEALRAAIKALNTDDLKAAEYALTLEFQVDEIEDRIIENSTNVAEAFIAKALERIGDLATNIAENVIFYVQAEDIRHGHFKDFTHS